MIFELKPHLRYLRPYWPKSASKFKVQLYLYFQNRRDHEEICPYKPVQCPEFDCSETRPMNEIFKHFRLGMC